MKQAHLYILTTFGLGDFYVIAVDPTAAEIALTKILDSEKYGFEAHRKVISIKWISSMLNKKSPFLSNKDLRLLIVND